MRRRGEWCEEAGNETGRQSERERESIRSLLSRKTFRKNITSSSLFGWSIHNTKLTAVETQHKTNVVLKVEWGTQKKREREREIRMKNGVSEEK